jgi:spore maturation protein CgeB
MKILFSGYHNPHFLTVTEYMENAIKALGHDLVVFDDRQHIIPGRLRQRIPWLHQLDLQRINEKIVKLAFKRRSDVTIVTGGHRIDGKAVERLNENGICTVLWTIDAPRDFQPIIDSAPLYKYVFCQGSEAVELLEAADIKGARWLPMACDPELHHPLELSEEERHQYGSDIVFVGSYYPSRAALLERLIGFDLGIWGPGWEQLERGSGLRSYIKAPHTKPSEWLKIYSASKIVLATHYQDPEKAFPVYQASPRIFEALACGAFVISDDQKDVFSLFREGEHLGRFMDPEDLVAKIIYYLDNPLEREEIACRGRTEVLNNHTYLQRIEKLLSIASYNDQGNG